MQNLVVLLLEQPLPPEPIVAVVAAVVVAVEVQRLVVMVARLAR